MDGSEGRESTLPVCAREWERKRGSQLQGGQGGWLRWCTPPAPHSPAERRMQEPKGWAGREELTRMHPPSGEARGVSNSGLD